MSCEGSPHGDAERILSFSKRVGTNSRGQYKPTDLNRLAEIG